MHGQDDFESALVIHPYFPAGVQTILTTGGSNFIGLIDDHTVLKYPHHQGNLDQLLVEAEIYNVLGRHSNIIGFKGKVDSGLLLAFAPHGSIERYLQENVASLAVRRKWATQVAEALVHVHERDVVHCDLNVSNILLDRSLNAQLCDFQGRILNADGSILRDGGALENAKSRMPQTQEDEANKKTDIFALGTAIYYIIQGHGPFPDLDTFDDESEIQRRFRCGKFPELRHELDREVVHKCWAAEYDSAKDVARALQQCSFP